MTNQSHTEKDVAEIAAIDRITRMLDLAERTVEVIRAEHAAIRALISTPDMPKGDD